MLHLYLLIRSYCIVPITWMFICNCYLSGHFFVICPKVEYYLIINTNKIRKMCLFSSPLVLNNFLKPFCEQGLNIRSGFLLSLLAITFTNIPIVFTRSFCLGCSCFSVWTWDKLILDSIQFFGYWKVIIEIDLRAWKMVWLVEWC